MPIRRRTLLAFGLVAATLFGFAAWAADGRFDLDRYRERVRRLKRPPPGRGVGHTASLASWPDVRPPGIARVLWDA